MSVLKLFQWFPLIFLSSPDNWVELWDHFSSRASAGDGDNKRKQPNPLTRRVNKPNKSIDGNISPTFPPRRREKTAGMREAVFPYEGNYLAETLTHLREQLGGLGGLGGCRHMAMPSVGMGIREYTSWWISGARVLFSVALSISLTLSPLTSHLWWA